MIRSLIAGALLGALSFAPVFAASVVSSHHHSTPAAANTITFPSLSASQLGAAAPALAATDSAGLPITYTSTTPSVCTVSGTTITMVTSGTCSITASQAGNNIYVAATPESQSFSISLITETGALSLPTGDAIHYISPTGNDANSGTSPSSPWLTPNHPLNCGDVVIAAAGSYTTQFQGAWGTVSNCPSTTGGVDGTGGVYFAALLCAGPNLTACPVAPTNGNGFDVTKSNWAVEGFSVSVNTTSQALFADACNVSSTLHHIAFVNDVVHGAGYGVDSTPCANSHGMDYFGVVGNIVQNANGWSGTCSFRGSALDINSPQALDTNPGTHIFVSGNFVAANVGPPCGGSDYEGMMADTWGGFSYNQQGVWSNNIVYDSAGFGMQVFGAGSSTLKIYNNTFFDNSVNIPVPGAFNTSEINIVPGTSAPTVTVQNNIARTNAATAAGGTPVYAMNMDSVTTATSPQPVVSSNTFFSLSTACEGVCAPTSGGAGNMVAVISCCTSPEFIYGTNNYVDPTFANTTDLLTNWVGAPDCSSAQSTDACMGWNFSSQTATSLTPIADLAPSGSGTSGQGYQGAAPGVASSPDYPTWLKGVVYLHWDGTTITEAAGLVTKPCGM